MGLYTENQSLIKPELPSISYMTHTFDKSSLLHPLPLDDFKVEEELLTKKRKILDEKAPGLFDYLTKLTTEEVSTETASSHGGDHEPEESKHTIHIPTPIKSQNCLSNINLSNVIKFNPQKPDPEGRMHCPERSNPIDNTNNEWAVKSLEDRQRQQIIQMSSHNSLMLNSVMSQQEHLQRLAMQCIEDLKYIKSQQHESLQTPLERIEQIKEEKRHSTSFDSNPTPALLFNHLFGKSAVYRYELVLDSELPTPIFRERNLILKARLVDSLTKQTVRNQNKILMQLALQTWEVPSSAILRNKTGNKAIMGETEVELKNGEVIFDRIQINEVTSKFIHGHVAVLIIPTKPVNHGTSLSEHAQSADYIDFELVKPLMLEKVVVKSKKKKNLKKKAE